MKFPLHLLLASAACAPLTSGYLPVSTTSSTIHLSHHRRNHATATRLHYKEPSFDRDGSDGSSSEDSGDASNVWTVLANTERWISDTLDRSNKLANERREAESKRRQQQQTDLENKFHFADEKNNKEGDEQQQQSSSTPSQQFPPVPRKDNPYARKEVTYVCETGDELASVVGGVFRRVREARELGEGHGRGVEARLGELQFVIVFCS